MLKPILQEIALEHDNVDLTLVNIDENPDTAALYQVKALPTIMILKNDQDFIRFTGMKSKKEILELLNL